MRFSPAYPILGLVVAVYASPVPALNSDDIAIRDVGDVISLGGASSISKRSTTHSRSDTESVFGVLFLTTGFQKPNIITELLFRKKVNEEEEAYVRSFLTEPSIANDLAIQTPYDKNLKLNFMNKFPVAEVNIVQSTFQYHLTSTVPGSKCNPQCTVTMPFKGRGGKNPTATIADNSGAPFATATVTAGGGKR